MNMTSDTLVAVENPWLVMGMMTAMTGMVTYIIYIWIYLNDSKLFRNKCHEMDDDNSSSSTLLCQRRLLNFEMEADQLSKMDIRMMRQTYFCAAQSISYNDKDDPLLAMKGEMQYLYDDKGVRYLDTRNNVGHVGWQHPDVVGAVQRQMARLNTNSRYIHPFRVLLAKKLLSKFPPELQTIVFVNSGSEANDLALRMARNHTQKQGTIVVERAYHGHTISTLEISPYKYEHKGGLAYQRDYVYKVPCPDVYRGMYQRNGSISSDDEIASKYANHVKLACDNGKGDIAAFFIESGMSVAGVILPPSGYLQKCYSHVRKVGAVCIADEVQVGFGRFGSSFWGFQQQGVIPDIVTLGKPIANGLPLAAVVTTKAIAESFHNGLEYFNTFGGNPVCCAAGLAVLDIIERDNLQEHAQNVGNYLKFKLSQLAKSKSGNLIGDIRGSGLFLGIELVLNRTTREPATAHTSILCSKLKDKFNILTSIDGPNDNVIVVKPPMCFNEENVDEFVEKIGLCLGDITENDLLNYTHIST